MEAALEKALDDASTVKTASPSKQVGDSVETFALELWRQLIFHFYFFTQSYLAFNIEQEFE